MIPDAEFSSRLVKEESDRLNAKVKALAPWEKEDIYSKGLQLLSKQELKEGK